MEHIVDKTFEDLNESESNRSRAMSESQVCLFIIMKKNIKCMLICSLSYVINLFIYYFALLHVIVKLSLSFVVSLHIHLDFFPLV